MEPQTIDVSKNPWDNANSPDKVYGKKARSGGTSDIKIEYPEIFSLLRISASFPFAKLNTLWTINTPHPAIAGKSPKIMAGECSLGVVSNACAAMIIPIQRRMDIPASMGTNAETRLISPNIPTTVIKNPLRME